MGQQARRNDPAAGKQRMWDGALFHGNMVVRPLTAPAAIGSLDMLHDLVLRRNVRQLPPQHCVPARVQRPAALRADPFFLRQLMDHLLRGRAGKVRLPFSRVLLPLVCNLLQVRRSVNANLKL